MGVLLMQEPHDHRHERQWWSNPVVVIGPVLCQCIGGLYVMLPESQVEVQQEGVPFCCHAVNGVGTPLPLESFEDQVVHLPLMQKQPAESVGPHVHGAWEVMCNEVDSTCIHEHEDLVHHLVQVQVLTSHLVHVGDHHDVVAMDEDALA